MMRRPEPISPAAGLVQQTHFYPGLDGLRAVMALWVLVGHVGNFMGWRLGASPPAWVKPFLLTSVPVNVFICLSGFVIFQMLGRMHWTGYGSYIKQRAQRILPIYWVAIVLAIVMLDFRLGVKSMVPWNSAADAVAFSAHSALVATNLQAHIASHLALVHGLIPEVLLPHAAESVLAPAWSLSLEWQFYLIAPAIYFLVVRHSLGFLGLVVALTHASLILPAAALGMTPAFFLISWPYFALGWWSSKCLDSQPWASRRETVLFMAPILILVPLALHQSTDVRATALSLALWVTVWMSCCMPAITGRGGAWARAILGNRHLVAVGKRSYSLYLLHVLVLDVVAYALIRSGWLDKSSALGFVVLLVPTLVVSLLLTWLTYSMVERRFMHKSSTVPAQA